MPEEKDINEMTPAEILLLIETVGIPAFLILVQLMNERKITWAEIEANLSRSDRITARWAAVDTVNMEPK